MAEEWIRAKHNYTATRPDELSFRKKDLLILVERGASKGWWFARTAEGKEGLVPHNYFTPAEAPAAASSDPFDALTAEWADSPAPVAQLASKNKGDDTDLDDWIRQIEAVTIAAAPIDRRATPAVVAAPIAAPVAVAQPPPKPEASTSTLPVEEDAATMWMRRCLELESQLSNVLRLHEQGEAALRAAHAAADESDRHVLAALERAEADAVERERFHDAEKAQLKAQLAAAQSRGVPEQPGRLAALDAQVATLTRELAEQQAMADRDMADEQAKHRAAVERAGELFDLYEQARVRCEDAERRLAAEQRAHADARDELVDLKHKTARMLELVHKQKRELEDQAARPLASPEAPEVAAELAQCRAELSRARHAEEELRGRLEEAQRAAQRLSRSHVAPPTPPAPAPAALVPLAAAPPPPPPPRSPMGERRSQPSKALPPVTADTGAMADLAAKVAQARAIRAKAAQETGVVTAPEPQPQPVPATPAAAAAVAPDEADASGGVSRSRANEILARARALAAKAKEAK